MTWRKTSIQQVALAWWLSTGIWISTFIATLRDWTLSRESMSQMCLRLPWRRWLISRVSKKPRLRQMHRSATILITKL
jgi:hypothetical protein